MAFNINVSIRYSSFLPVLMEVMKRSSGDVLELGAGVFSTPFLHWTCEKEKRNLLTIESDWKWHFFTRKYYRTDLHKHIHTRNWDNIKAEIEKRWDVVLVDHSPSGRRVSEIKILANLANYIIIHDADANKDYQFHYSTIYPLFKYRYDFTEIEPATTVLSNFVDLSDFSV